MNQYWQLNRLANTNYYRIGIVVKMYSYTAITYNKCGADLYSHSKNKASADELINLWIYVPCLSENAVLLLLLVSF